MKKLLSLSASKILVTCALGMAVTLGAFWHHQVNQTELDRLSVLNQGIGTCFNRISQTFTAMMIKDIQSPYLNRGFMGLSDECLNETIKGINPFKQNVGKGYETLNQLISEVHWFHEKVLKTHAPMLAGQDLNPSMAPLSDRFSKMETYKVNLADEIDSAITQIKEIQVNDEILMGAGLILFVLALSILSLQEFNRIQLTSEIEKKALNLLKAGNANVGAMVDDLVSKALVTQNMTVTAQIFKDYHGNILERLSTRTSNDEMNTPAVLETPDEVTAVSANVPRTNLKEVLVSIQNIHAKDLIQLSEVRDVALAIDFETFEQMMNAAVNKLATRRTNDKKIMVSNQIHSDKSIINLFLPQSIFTAAELEYCSSANNAATDTNDMNLIILKEMVNVAGVNWHLENKTNRQGQVTGMSIRFIINKATKDNKSKLISVVKGKKKDIVREMMN